MAIQLIRIVHAHGTAATWTSLNPVLMLAEEGYESDTGKLKIGDGSTAWNALPYIQAAPIGTAGGALAGAYPNPTLSGSASLAQSQVTGLPATLALLAPLASAALTGSPTAPTAASGDNTTLIANTAMVQSAIVARALLGTNNLSDVGNAVTAVNNLKTASGANFGMITSLYFGTPGTATLDISTYPTAAAVRVRVQGGGGGGGGVAAGTGTQVGASGGGGGGTYGETWIAASSLPIPVTITVGAGGTGATAGNNAGGNGGVSSFGPFLSCPGGTGGPGSGVNAGPFASPGGAGGTTATGSAAILSIPGGDGQPGFWSVVAGGTALVVSGQGGVAVLGHGGASAQMSHAPGGYGVGRGGGAAGSVNNVSQAAIGSVSGAPGVVIVDVFG